MNRIHRISYDPDSHGHYSIHLSGIRTLSEMTFSVPAGMETCVATRGHKAIFYYASRDSFGSLRCSSPDPSFYFYRSLPRDSSVADIKSILKPIL